MFSFLKAHAKKAALKGGLDKTVSLRKDLSEMHEWITQAEEEYLERDFEYKTPDELQKAVEELKVRDEQSPWTAFKVLFEESFIKKVYSHSKRSLLIPSFSAWNLKQ